MLKPHICLQMFRYTIFLVCNYSITSAFLLFVLPYLYRLFNTVNYNVLLLHQSRINHFIFSGRLLLFVIFLSVVAMRSWLASSCRLLLFVITPSVVGCWLVSSYRLPLFVTSLSIVKCCFVVDIFILASKLSLNGGVCITIIHDISTHWRMYSRICSNCSGLRWVLFRCSFNFSEHF